MGHPYVTRLIPPICWKACDANATPARHPFFSGPLEKNSFTVSFLPVVMALTFLISSTSRSSSASSTVVLCRLARMRSASSSRPCLSSHRGDSGNSRMPPIRMRPKTAWKASGKRHWNEFWLMNQKP